MSLRVASLSKYIYILITSMNLQSIIQQISAEIMSIDTIFSYVLMDEFIWSYFRIRVAFFNGNRVMNSIFSIKLIYTFISMSLNALRQA